MAPWITILLIILEVGPKILEVIMEIISLIKKKPLPERARHYASLKAALLEMKSNKLKGTSSLIALRDSLKFSF